MEFKEFENARLSLGLSVGDTCALVDSNKRSYARWRNKGDVPNEKFELLIETTKISKDDNKQLTASIDYLRVRFRTCQFQRIINEVMGLGNKPFISEVYSRYGYTGFESFNHINLYYAVDDDQQGTLIEMTGQGCREFEWYLINEQKRSWTDFFKKCYEFSSSFEDKHFDRKDFVRFTRIDIALDEHYSEIGNYDLGRLNEKKEAGLISRKAKKYRFIDGESNKKSDGKTIYFGTRQSDVMLSFYEKDYEQCAKLKLELSTYHKLYGLKNRYEIRLNGDASNKFIFDHIHKKTDIGLEAIKVLNYQLQVFEMKDSRRVLDIEWYSIFGVTDVVKFEMKPKYFPIGEKEYQWYERSVAGVRKRLEIIENITGKSRLEEIDELAEVKEKFRPQLDYLAEKYGVEILYD
ncbi:replication initiation factor domain-containing protein [Streptococcus parauberis]|uniref:replication initiation factor domain-containing protein n=1 Tax=Streptococcus parauberis TaxID=1348 RepID=UPI000CCE8148|nr:MULTISPECIES: replication initiation factor domain-containing protein [Streptococcus]PNY21695.1 Replication initiation factor [Streptococcus parauberis]QGG98512.1 replication initiation factor domain-containing protein [Streptococcus dysgalactiae subsp. dysgalactiae]WHL24061.1 replication initiation factor domain-containing protein [Streptococcus iniae]